MHTSTKLGLVVLFQLFGVGGEALAQEGEGAAAPTKVFSFDQNAEGWGLFGDGEQAFVDGLGHNAAGCVQLRCASGQQMTMHKKFNLPAGRYLVTTWMRGFEIKEGAYNVSVWLFYNVTGELQNAYQNINGTFEWSRARYTVDIPEDHTEGNQFWVRLRSPGTLWVDDISIEPYDGEPIAWEWTLSEKPFPRANPIGEGVRCRSCYRWMPEEAGNCYLCGAPMPKAQWDEEVTQAERPSERLLLGFEPDRVETETPLSYISNTTTQTCTEGTTAGVIHLGAYNNLRMDQPGTRDWSGYDYIAMDVYNPLPQLEKFVLAISDGQGGGYWNQLNHYTMLSPGWNELRFHVNRFVGERGSVKIARYLDLKNLSRFWFAVCPEDKRGLQAEFFVDNIRLLKAPAAPVAPTGAVLLDFVKESFRAQPGFLPIMECHQYHPDVGFGFQEAKIWRTHDSEYVDSLNRDGLFVNSGTFRLDVSNGTYRVLLGARHLGYWSEHFWSRRKITIQNQVVEDKIRTEASQHLADFLRWEDIEPEKADNPYDLYIRDLFAPIEVMCNVTNGQLVIDMKGDNSAICLNWLIVAPEEQSPELDRFMAALYEVQKDEFDNLARRVSPPARGGPDVLKEDDLDRGFYAALVEHHIMVRTDDIIASLGDQIDLQGGGEERPVQALMVRNLSGATQDLSIHSTALTSESGAVLEPADEWIRRGINQYQCHSFNHETYELTPRFLKPLVSAYPLPPERSTLIWYQIPIPEGQAPGVYTGELEIKVGDQSILYPVSLTVHPYTLPPLDVSAGYFGLTPVWYNYVTANGVSESRMHYRSVTLDLLADRGFTAYTGFPEATLVQNETGWVIESPEMDALMRQAKERGFTFKTLSYGSGNWNNILQLDAEGGPIMDMEAEEYRRISAQALKKKIDEWGIPLSITYSDEAAGYSGKVSRDLKRSQLLKTYYPFLGRSGASGLHAGNEEAQQLNFSFSEVLLSSNSREYATALDEAGIEWGMYNPSTGLFMYDRPAYGRGLYVMKENGMSYLHNFALTLYANYPYYDLDGREFDAMMIFPRTDGSMLAGLKLEWAAIGVEDCRLLMLLERLIEEKGEEADEAKAWLYKTVGQVDPFSAEYEAGGYLGYVMRNETESSLNQMRDEMRTHILNLVARETP